MLCFFFFVEIILYHFRISAERERVSNKVHKMFICILCFKPQIKRKPLPGNEKLTELLTVTDAIKFNFPFVAVKIFGI